VALQENLVLWSTFAFAVAAITAAGAARKGLLTGAGAAGATVFGGVILSLGGWAWGAAVAGSFFLTSLLSLRRDRIQDNPPDRAAAKRNLGQVLANGSLPAALALLVPFLDSSGLEAAFLGSVAAVAGDTWATAVGVTSTTAPRLITTWKRVPPGTPGAVTSVGLVLSATAGMAAGAFYLGAGALSGVDLSWPSTMPMLLAAVVGGLLGSLSDSFAGACLQGQYRDASGRVTDHPVDAQGQLNPWLRGWRWLDNNLVNFLGSVVGAAGGLAVWYGVTALGS
jgi:uncharacterized protein (TIGR00297 family)